MFVFWAEHSILGLLNISKQSMMFSSLFWMLYLVQPKPELSYSDDLSRVQKRKIMFQFLIYTLLMAVEIF